jgi:hypothetical protein
MVGNTGQIGYAGGKRGLWGNGSVAGKPDNSFGKFLHTVPSFLFSFPEDTQGFHF